MSFTIICDKCNEQQEITNGNLSSGEIEFTVINGWHGCSPDMTIKCKKCNNEIEN